MILQLICCFLLLSVRWAAVNSRREEELVHFITVSDKEIAHIEKIIKECDPQNLALESELTDWQKTYCPSTPENYERFKKVRLKFALETKIYHLEQLKEIWMKKQSGSNQDL